MELLIPFAVVAAAYPVLFVISGGLFRAGAEKLLAMFPALRTVTDRETLSKALLIVLLADLLGAASTWQMLENDTASKGYLLRNEYGGGDEEAMLTAEVSGETRDTTLVVRARQMSEEEIRSALDQAEEGLWELVLTGQDPEHVDEDLSLPENYPELPVTIAWMTERPDLIDFDGHLTDAVPKDGVEVLLSAELACEEAFRETELTVTLFPRHKDGAEAWQAAVENEVSKSNRDTELKVLLPASIEGNAVRWKLRQENTGMLLLLLGILIAVIFVYSKVKLKEIAETERAEQMVRDYPNLVNKLMLLVSAGMSMRKAFERIRRDYLAGVASGNPKRAGYEEIVRVSLELENGMSEPEAYAAMGRRSRPKEYKTFAVLLVQSTQKGGSELSEILSLEARQACEERKKRARVLGEEAGTKLLLPMVLMLGIVMAILMVPAFLTFV